MFKCFKRGKQKHKVSYYNGSSRIVTVSDVSVLGFCHCYFVIRICFEFQVSDFGFK